MKLTISHISGLGVGLVLLLAAQTGSIVNNKVRDQIAIANLADGQYQFCSQSDPKGWQDGAGVCLNFRKIGHRIDGYYAYPHSDHFICVRGQVNNNLITGEALAISSPMNELSQIPKSEWKWDLEERLTLNQGKIVRSLKDEWGRVDWIIFPNARLNVDGFYQYKSPRMTPPSQLCDWN